MIKELATLALEKRVPVGIFVPVYKDLAPTYRALKLMFEPVIIDKDEMIKWMKFIGGGELECWSMHEPDSGRGRKYARVIIDEFAKAKKNKQAWQEAIRATLAYYQGDAWFLSTPKGKSNYFYQMRIDHADDENWSFHRFKSVENPYLEESEIELARKQLHPIIYAQEYEAEDVDLNDRPYLFAFDEAKHVAPGVTEILNPHLPIRFSFDFNKDPMTCIVGQRLSLTHLIIVEAIAMIDGSTPEICEQLIAKYPGWSETWEVTGDATGRNRTPLERGSINHWIKIKDMLRLRDRQIFVRKANISHYNSRMVCNSVLQNTTHEIDDELRDFINDLAFANVDENGKPVKTQMDGFHYFDAWRYLIDSEYSDFISNARKYHLPTNGIEA